jgi:hypothetical protein
MNLRLDCVAVRQCGSVRQYERQCAAVRLVVHGSVRGSVRLSGSAAVCSSVRQCAWLLICDSTCGGVRQCVDRPVCGSVWQ